MKTVLEWKASLRERLKAALRGRDASAVSLYRETLAALDHAEAPDVQLGPATTRGVIAGALVGLGAGEAPRLALTPDDVNTIVERELRERQEAAASYQALGRDQEAAVLRRQAGLLESMFTN